MALLASNEPVHQYSCLKLHYSNKLIKQIRIQDKSIKKKLKLQPVFPIQVELLSFSKKITIQVNNHHFHRSKVRWFLMLSDCRIFELKLSTQNYTSHLPDITEAPSNDRPMHLLKSMSVCCNSCNNKLHVYSADPWSIGL